MKTSLPEPGAPFGHFVSDAPFDPYAAERKTEELQAVAQASQFQLMWWHFRRHKMALASGIFLILVYLMITISEFLAPYNLHTRNIDFIYSPPQTLRFMHEGAFVGPFVYGQNMTLNMD
ncbi:MAG: ABC transporter permease, partial [Shinella sp.]